MPVTKGLRATSPVHVHVDDDIPVHVHVKQPKKKKTVSTGAKKSSRVTGSTISSRARSKSPVSSWVPPPARASKGNKVQWQGSTHRLEIHTPRDTLRMDDLSTDEEDRVHTEMRHYENKIENLMSEVGTLKNEVELQKTIRDKERKEDILNNSLRVLEEQEQEIEEYREELTATERENRILRKSMGLLQDEADTVRVEADILNREREKLMKKLIEVEMDGQGAAKQASQLRELVRKFRQDTRITQGDSARLTKQKDLLLEKLADFEATNRTLRRLLREQHKQEAAALRLSEQRDMLIKKLADTDISNERLRGELLDRDRMIAELRVQINANRVKSQLHTRLQELQPLPEMLKDTELKLHETEDRLRLSEKKNADNDRLIAELTAKLDGLSEQMEKMRDKLQGSQSDNHSMGDRVSTLERRLQEAEEQNRNLLTTVARREEALHQNNLRLEDRERENASLTRQLENALTDIRRQQEQNRDKQASKERTLQTRIVDLEAQLSQTRAEVARVKREKEEMERKFNSRLYDLKDRLEQSHSTNRSMQNYVQFLKNSYANVFGDSSVMPPSTPMRPGYP